MSKSEGGHEVVLRGHLGDLDIYERHNFSLLLCQGKWFSRIIDDE